MARAHTQSASRAGRDQDRTSQRHEDAQQYLASEEGTRNLLGNLWPLIEPARPIPTVPLPGETVIPCKGEGYAIDKSRSEHWIVKGEGKYQSAICRADLYLRLRLVRPELIGVEDSRGSVRWEGRRYRVLRWSQPERQYSIMVEVKGYEVNPSEILAQVNFQKLWTQADLWVAAVAYSLKPRDRAYLLSQRVTPIEIGPAVNEWLDRQEPQE